MGTTYFSGFSYKIPQGTPAFQTGWKDGCETSSYSRGNIFYRTFRKHNYNTKMIGNPEYRFGYGRGYTWCFQNVVSGIGGPQASFDRALAPYADNKTYGYGVFDTKADNIGVMWGGFFGSDIMSSGANEGWDASLGVLQKGGAGTGKSAFGTILWEGGSKGQFFGQ